MNFLISLFLLNIKQFLDGRFKQTNTYASPTLTFSIPLPLVDSFRLPQTIICEVFKNYIAKTEMTITWSSTIISRPSTTSSYVFPSSISANLDSYSYNKGINLYYIALSYVTYTSYITGTDELRLITSSGTFERCFISGYSCTVRDGKIYIKPRSG